MKKSELRKNFIQNRKSISFEQKAKSDSGILDNIKGFNGLLNFKNILCYVSVKDEPDTKKIIDYFLDNGKNIYVPYCLNKDMFFYKLKSRTELVDGAFGIPTVEINNKEPLNNFDECVCIVPGLAFDFNGNRLGYGGGYYDRFLKDKNIFKIGIVYEQCFIPNLPAEDFDIAVDAVVTEQKIFRRKL